MTTYTLTVLLVILFTHFCGDFMFQTRTMGLNKGKSIKWLTYHVLAYSATLLVGTFIVTQNFMFSLEFTLWSGAIHWVTDYFTSKGSGYCYIKMMQAKEEQEVYRRMANEKGEEFVEDTTKEHTWQYWFWSVIGFDQFVHGAALIAAYHFLS